jgi:hypothetical protein
VGIASCDSTEELPIVARRDKDEIMEEPESDMQVYLSENAWWCGLVSSRPMFWRLR